MKISKQSIAVALMVLLLLATTVPALALTSFPPVPGTDIPDRTLGFGGCSLNSPGDTAIGVAQFRVEVYPWGTNQAMFVFYNSGTEQAVIEAVYFDDGVLLGISDLYDLDDPTDPNSNPNTGVDFSLNASPPNLPSPNCVVPSFGNLVVYSADADSPPPAKGIGPGEFLGVVFDLQPGATYQQLLAGLDAGVVRIGVHAIAYASGGSESFVTTNATAIKLDSFNASASRSRVALNWRTGTEVSNAGFNLYRSSAASAARVRVNGGIIAARGEAVSGASYSFIDAPGYGTFYYWLEDVEFTGKATLHGPVKVTVAPSLGRPLYRPVLPGAR